MYGPVRVVVWEGRNREIPPYPDFLDEEGVTDDFMTERASQQQREREPFDS